MQPPGDLETAQGGGRSTGAFQVESSLLSDINEVPLLLTETGTLHLDGHVACTQVAPVGVRAKKTYERTSQGPLDAIALLAFALIAFGP